MKITHLIIPIFFFNFTFITAQEIFPDRPVNIYPDKSLALTYRETEKPYNADIKFPNFILIAENTLPNTNYTLIKRDFLGRFRMKINCIIDSKGRLRPKDNRKQILAIQTFDFLPGEPVEFFLIEDNMKQVARAKIIPRPIISENPNGYKISVELFEETGNVFNLRLVGYEPKEEVIILLKNGIEEKTIVELADDLGRIERVISPLVEGRNGGFSEVEVIGKKGNAKLKFPWGSSLIKLGIKMLNTENQSTS